MLEPSVRTLFFETLRPPEGYRLDEAIATTFTLDLITLLTAPLAFTSFEWSDAEGKPTCDPVLLLEALRRNADRLTVFCQVGRACAPAHQGILYNYLEPMVIEVTAPLGGVFHPKLWLLRYLADDQPTIIRLVVLSRNVTGDRSWDISLVLDGEVADRKKGFASNAAFAEFIQALPGLAVRPLDPAISERANRLAEEVRRTEFELPEGFEKYELLPLGLKKRRGLPFTEKRDRMVVISPFVSPGFLADLVGDSTGHVMVSRMEELSKLPKGSLAPFDQVYVLAEAAENQDSASEEAMETESTLTGLHAKLYLIDEGWDSVLYLGSPNATGQAFAKNVELLVALRGKKSKVGVDQVLEKTDGQAGLLDLLTPFVPPEVPVGDTIEEVLERELDAFRLVLGTAGLAATVAESGEQFSLVLKGTKSVVLPEGVTASIWPITVSEDANAKRFDADGPALAFGPLPLAAVTSFFGISARATRQGKTAEARFVLNLPLENAPSGRREAIMGALLDDPEKFMRFLQFLLGDLDDLGATQAGSDHSGDNNFGSWGSGGFVLFESLLRALKDDPQRLDYVASALKEIAVTPEGLRRLPQGFLSVWDPIWAARLEIPK